MRFGIVGADKESGNDVEIVVTAANQTEAELEACRRNILVSGIKTIAEDDQDAIALVDDETEEATVPAGASRAGMSVAAAQAQASGRSNMGTITMNANSPSGSARSGEGAAPGGGEAKAQTAMEYHILMNQSLYLLETAVNKQLRDGWEPQGGLMVAFTNNQTQFYQAVVRRKG